VTQAGGSEGASTRAAVSESARTTRGRLVDVRRIPFIEEVVAVLADRGGLPPRLLESRARVPAATGRTTRSGEQQRQARHCYRPDDDA
jgi:hypothetical protein